VQVAVTPVLEVIQYLGLLLHTVGATVVLIVQQLVVTGVLAEVLVLEVVLVLM
jgi:hypothetical protein